jgi:hypothetical protein
MKVHRVSTDVDGTYKPRARARRRRPTADCKQRNFPRSTCVDACNRWLSSAEAECMTEVEWHDVNDLYCCVSAARCPKVSLEAASS